MVTKEKAKQEIILSKGEDIFDDCPCCHEELEHRWQHNEYGDFNPVRWCHSCDTAWIWEKA